MLTTNKEKIVIYLHASDLTHPSWMLIDNQNHIQQLTCDGDPANLATLTADKDIIVLAPAEDILLVAAKLPKMSHNRLVQALPYALEEHLTEDVEALHFAPATPSNQQEAEGLPVAIVARTKMQLWLTQLQDWNIQPDILTSILFALPYAEGQWHIAIDEMAMVRMAAFRGFACDKNNLAELLELAITSTTAPPSHIHIYNASTQNYDLSFDLPIQIEETPCSQEQLLTGFAQEIIKQPTINLLQGVYVSKKVKFPAMKKILHTMALLAVAWGIFLFVYPTVSYIMLNQQANKINNQIAQIYKLNFPQATSYVAPKLRMQEKLQKLLSQVGANRLLLLLGHVGEATTNIPSITLKSFDFQDNQLTLELTAPTSEDLAKFADFLTQQGLSVKQQNVNLSGAHISANLMIE